jgi:hypothetical protein
MPLTLNGTTGIAGVDGSAGTPASQGSDTNTGIVYGVDTVSISTGGVTRASVNSDGQVVVSAGTASLPGITTSGDTNTGTFYPAADTIGWTTGGTERARIDTSGNLLVGTTSSPTAAKVRVTATPSSSWAMDFSENSVTVANGGNQTFPAGSGLVLINNPATGATAVYVVGGGNATLLNTAGPEWVASTTSPAAGKFSVAYNSGSSLYAVYNNYGSSQNFNVALLRARTSV